MKAQKARMLRMFCCSLCVLCRLETPKARVLRVFCSLEAEKARVLRVFCGLEEPGRSKCVLRERPRKRPEACWSPDESWVSMWGAK